MIYIIVPVYKVEEYLDRCVKSILEQTHTAFRLILVDDGSPDRCPLMCDAYERKDSRIHVIHQQNGGLSAARNTGIDYALSQDDCEWITFIDSDDWVHPQYIEILESTANKYGLKAVRVSEQNVTSPPKDTQNITEPLINIVDSVTYHISHDLVVSWGILYHKDCFNGVRFPLGRLHEDLYTTHRLLYATKQIAIIEDTLYYYYQNPVGISKTRNAKRVYDCIDGVKQRIRDFGNYGRDWKLVKNQNVFHLKYILLQNYQRADAIVQRRIKKELRRVIWYPHLKPSETLMDQPKYWAIAYPCATKCIMPIINISHKIFRRK